MSRRLAVALPALASPADQARALPQAGLLALLAAKTVGGWGVQWDIRWHVVVGRDWFWIAPHVMIYAAVAAAAALALGVLALDTARRRRGQPVPGAVTVAGLTGSAGWHLAWWGILLTILSAPFDELWHRLFGLDVTLWSPPHLAGLLGAQLNSLGCLVIAGEALPASRARLAGQLWSGVLLLAVFSVIADEAIQTAHRHGGLRFFTWAVLAGLLFTFAHVLTARLTGLPAAPLVLAAGALALHVVGIGLGDVGMAALAPPSMVAEVIATDPGSPIALAQEMARLNGNTPGRALHLRALPLVPALLMALVPAGHGRRWPLAAALGGAGLALGSLALATLPALRHAAPDPSDTALALALAVAAALAGGAAGRRLADTLHPRRPR